MSTKTNQTPSSEETKLREVLRQFLNECMNERAVEDVFDNIDLQIAEAKREVAEEVDAKVKLYHKTCLTDKFDNGKFWAYKEMQTHLTPTKGDK